MKITINKDDLLSKFLDPIARVSERCVISIYPKYIESLVSTSELNPVLYGKVNTDSDIGDKKCVNLNIPIYR
jgi:hypothetical protein